VIRIAAGPVSGNKSACSCPAPDGGTTTRRIGRVSAAFGSQKVLNEVRLVNDLSSNSLFNVQTAFGKRPNYICRLLTRDT